MMLKALYKLSRTTEAEEFFTQLSRSLAEAIAGGETQLLISFLEAYEMAVARKARGHPFEAVDVLVAECLEVTYGHAEGG